MPDTVPTHDFAIRRAEVMQPAGTASATFCHCDINAHMNNTVYADLVCDALPLELMRERPISSLILAYHRELKLGEQMDLTLGTLENGDFAAAGHRGGDAIFEANAAFRA